MNRPVRESRTVTGDLSLHTGLLRPDWCTACKAWTRITTDLLLLAPSGITTFGPVSWCEICDDPTIPHPVRRIDRG